MFNNKSLFGNNLNQPPQSTGLFGAQPNQSGLFGTQQPQQQNPQGTSLWNNQSQGFPAQSNQGGLGAGNLFGQNNMNQQGSLFGNKSAPAPFGQQSQPNTGTGMSLFGQAAQGTQSSSLFGKTTPQTQSAAPGSFMQQNTVPSGNLFSSFGPQNQTQQQQTQPTSLFGGMQNNAGMIGGNPSPNTGSSIFGTSTQQTTQPSIVFGNQQKQQTSSLFNTNQQITQPNTGTSIFGNQQQNTMNQATGIFGSGMNTNKPAVGGTGLFGNQTTVGGNQPGGIFGNNSTNQNQGIFGQNQTTSNTNVLGFNKQNTIGGGFPNAAPANIQGTFGIQYNITTVDEPSFSKQGGQQRPVPVRLISITAMNEYSTKSLEELRQDDYNLKKTGMVNNMKTPQIQSGMSGNLFGQQNQSQNPQQMNNQGVFGANTQTGMNSLFPKQQTTNQSNFGTSLFGVQNNTTGLQSNVNQQQQTSGLFGLQQNNLNSQQQQTLFSSQAQTGGLFNQQQNQTAGLFVQNKPAGAFFGNTNTTTSNLGVSTGTSMLGNNQQPQGTGTSLFSPIGQNTNQPASGMGLFGANSSNPPQQQPGGLFGNSSQPSTGLFGNQQQTTSSTLGGTQNSLFGNVAPNLQSNNSFIGNSLYPGQQNKPATGGLFGQTAAPQTSSTSLFSGQNATQQQQQGGLFSSLNNSSSSGLFGNTNQAQNTGNSLFGNTTSNVAAKPAASGLFSNPTGAQSSLFGGPSGTSSLFGNAGTTQQSSLFGNSNPQSSSLFGGDALKGGLFTNNAVSTGQTQQSSFGNQGNPIQGQINQNFVQQNKIPNAFIDLINLDKKSMDEMLEEIQRNYIEEQLNNSLRKFNTKSQNIYSEEFKRFNPEMLPYDMKNRYTDFQYYQVDADRSEYFRSKEFSYGDSFLKSKRTGEYGKKFDLLESSPTSESKKSSMQNINILKHLQQKKEIELMKNLKISPSEIYGEKNHEKVSHLKYSESQEKLFGNMDVKRDKSYEPISRNVSNNYINKLEADVDNLFLETKKSELNEYENILDLKIVLHDPEPVTIDIKIKRSKSISVLKRAIVDELLRVNSIIFRKINEHSFLLIKNYSIIKDDETIETARLNNKDILHILFKERCEKVKIKTEENEISNRKDSSNSIVGEHKKKRNISKTRENKEKDSKTELAPIEKLPKMIKKGYEFNPSYSEICRMTLKELENVNNFTISNEYGKIEFKGVTDLTGLNIDQIVNISEREISLYRNGKSNVSPEIGRGLNKPAILTMYKLKPELIDDDYDDKKDYGKFLDSLHQLCDNMGAEFLEYDKKEGVLKFRVEHF